jgi:hypothetical protein
MIEGDKVQEVIEQVRHDRQGKWRQKVDDDVQDYR